jgi:DNA modification methylase
MVPDTEGPAHPAPYYEDADAGIVLHLGEALDILPTLPDVSIDAIVCDPPYGLANLHPRVVAAALAAWLAGDRTYVPSDGQGGFMNRTWDRFVPPPAVWDQCLRVLKPGGHLVAFAAPRTADLMGLSIRLAGFEIRDSLHWIFGSGFPKGQDIAKSIDRRRDDREQILQVTAWLAAARDTAGWTNAQIDALWGYNGMAGLWTTQGKAALVPLPDQWDRLRSELGFDDVDICPLVAELNARKGTLGEAWSQREVISHRHSGLAEGATSVFLNGATGRSVDGSIPVTVPASEAAQHWQGWNTSLKPAHEPIILARKSTGYESTVANVLLHGTGALNIDGCRTVAGQDYRDKCASVVGLGSNRNGDAYGNWTGTREDSAHAAGRWPTNVLLTHQPLIDADGQVIGDACADGCVPDCPVADMDQQSGVTVSKASRRGERGGTVYNGPTGPDSVRGHDDAGGASRFFPVFRYEAKAPDSERPRLPDGTAHPTVKPLALMRWLVRLVTQPGGRVLDWCVGTGTTLEACVIEGFPSIGIERERPYADLCVARLSKPIALDLFGGEPS